MSLSNPTKQSTSPIKRYFKWNGSTGTITHYDKDTETNIETKLPLNIIPIDQLACVEGYNAKSDKGFRSNEVKRTSDQPLTIRWNGGSIIVEGLYKNIKEKIALLGGKYHQSIYFVTMINGKLEICNLKLKGAAMSAWLDLQKGLTAGVEGNQITINKSEEMKTGNVPYFVPVFTIKKAPQKVYEEAISLDGELQSYFNNRNNVVEVSEQSEESFMSDKVDTSQPTAEEMKSLRKPTEKRVEKQILEEKSSDDWDSWDTEK